MTKQIHEIRDPIYGFIRLDSTERKVLDSRPFQRLRHIHQLALTYLVYPGATHKRFEHSLGVMELATRIFNVIFNPELPSETKEYVPDLTKSEFDYCRRLLRMAALCHDLGHLPFSHAAEADLLPDGWDHERLTREIILGPELRGIWDGIRPHLVPEDIVKVALGPKKVKDLKFLKIEEILSEIIVGDSFGADRIDYLLRDSYHAGVAYGKFDYFRLVDTLRILRQPPSQDKPESEEPMLGIEEGGLHSAEALLLARYFMFSQVYFHPVRRIYDIHLQDFLSQWLAGGQFPTDTDELLAITDNEVTSAILKAADNPDEPGHDPAMRIVYRKHYRRFYQRREEDINQNPEFPDVLYKAACEEFEESRIRFDPYTQKGYSLDFPVLRNDDEIASARPMSQILKNIPVISLSCIFIDPDLLESARKWLRDNREGIMKKAISAQEEGDEQ